MKENERPKAVITRQLPVFYREQFPNSTIDDGFSLYKGVLIQWSTMWDIRICTFIDDLSPVYRENLLACQAHKGGISLLWKNNSMIPPGIKERRRVEVEMDFWSVDRSTWVEEVE